MTLKIVLLFALVAATLARPDTPRPSYNAPAPSYNAPAPSYSAPAPEAPPKYDYNYAVKDEYSGNDFGAQEARDGYDTQGSYYVQLPDGRLQKVTYTVKGDSGFVAEVTYEGEAQYPQQSYAPAPAPSYGPTPAPSYGPTPAPSYRPAPTPPAYHFMLRFTNKLAISRHLPHAAATLALTALSTPASQSNISPNIIRRRVPLGHHLGSSSAALNMTLKVVLLSALLAATFARPDTLRPSYGAPAPSYSAPAPEAPPKYDYNYAVKDEYSGNDFGAQEARDGYDTQGSYYVQLPDGRLQKVTYTVNGDSGFVAEVTYEGEAQYPQQSYASAPAPSYGPAPAPSYKPAPTPPAYHIIRRRVPLGHHLGSSSAALNMTLKVVLLSALLAATFARPDTLRPSYGAPAPSYSAPAPEAPPKYDYNYAVKDEYSGNDFGAQEARDGYDTQGSYYVQLPDGRLQKVTYTVNGDSGFVAEVTYEGEAQYPQQSYAPAPAPSYGPAPAPSYKPAPTPPAYQ
ncbi:DNA-directed RNA polymerase II subunit RPB1-like [Scylla paramamosain]|uniref:DNA-directed RNA polymerase II subunit RPB1-like n=1 Tax=Scylla paramamosain TaxID=85552 RepID=UPI0030827858